MNKAETLRNRVYSSLENNKKIYEFFIVLQSSFYKSYLYGHHFVDFIELFLKIYVLLQSDILFGKYHVFLGFATTLVFTKFSIFVISPNEYIRPYRTSKYLESGFYKLQNGI
jgi:hypothetical protein